MSTEREWRGPLAREVSLVIEELSDELLIYDLNRHKAHCLNRTAAWVWKHCDGRRTVEEMAVLMSEELKTPVNEQLIRLALDKLGKEHLLERRFVPPPMMGQLNRRQIARALGAGAIVIIPLITSIVAPTAEAATSCKGAGGGCMFGTECCSGVCKINGTCQ